MKKGGTRRSSGVPPSLQRQPGRDPLAGAQEGKQNMLDFIKINHDDKVAVALHPLEKGSVLNVDGEEITLIEDIPQAHKFAMKDIKEGEPIIKYGLRIGYAKEDIKKGAWIHVHNIRTALGDKLEYKYEPDIPVVAPTEHATFRGYRRKDGKVGIRNDIWILPTVGCVNSVVKGMEQMAKEQFSLGNAEEGVEDIYCFNHPYGCSQMGDDQENTRKVLASIIHHPNAAGVLVVGLGCENSNIPVLMDYIGEYDISGSTIPSGSSSWCARILRMRMKKP